MKKERPRGSERVYAAAMDPLYRKIIVQSALGLLFFAAIVFFCAGTFDYWQGWAFIAVFFASTMGFTAYMVLYDRPLLERCMKSGPQYEKEFAQKIIVSLVFILFFASMILPVLDYRYQFSPVPVFVSVIGDVLVALSFLFMFWVLTINSYAAANVRIEESQPVIDSGPYAYVRHPMYAGAIWLFVGIPLALGSWWSLSLIVLVLPVLAWRLLDEEKILRRDLSGYSEYTHKVRYRLIPHIW